MQLPRDCVPRVLHLATRRLGNRLYSLRPLPKAQKDNPNANDLSKKSAVANQDKTQYCPGGGAPIPPGVYPGISGCQDHWLIPGGELQHKLPDGTALPDGECYDPFLGYVLLCQPTGSGADNNDGNSTNTNTNGGGKGGDDKPKSCPEGQLLINGVCEPSGGGGTSIEDQCKDPSQYTTHRYYKLAGHVYPYPNTNTNICPDWQKPGPSGVCGQIPPCKLSLSDPSCQTAKP